MGCVKFLLNGESVTLTPDVDPSTSLAEFLRLRTKFKGTKIACGEGGCGACTVQVAEYRQREDNVSTTTINSCLCPVGTLHGKAITTVEGIGNSKSSFHALQESFAKNFASQCGYCTPGFVVASHAALEQANAAGKKPTPEQIQQSLDGNLCRCTGYRPILDACKAVADNFDIEELCQQHDKCATCPARDSWKAELCSSLKAFDQPAISALLPVHSHHNKHWYAPKTLRCLLLLLERHAAERPHLLAGNTGAGVYKYWPSNAVVLDVKEVKEFKEVEWAQDGLVLGAAVTLEQLIELLRQPRVPNADAAQVIIRHLHRIAGTQVRHAATLGGHVALSHSHALESDVCTLLLALDAQVGLASLEGHRWTSLEAFLRDGFSSSLDTAEVISAVKFPLPATGDYYWSHKVALRYYNSHALVNLAVWKKKEGKAIIALGCPARNETGELRWRAATLPRLDGVSSGSTLTPQGLVAALSTLQGQLGDAAGDSELDYAHRAAEALLFMALVPLLDPAPLADNPAFKVLVEGVAPLPLPPPVQATQTFPDYKTENAPLHQPVMKDTVLLQTSGEAHYMSDALGSYGQLYAAYVTSTEALAAIDAVDPSAALAAGAVAFLSAKDVPGTNQGYDCPLFADGVATYYGQPIGVVLANSPREAEAAAKLVSVTYSHPSNLGSPIITLDQAIKAGSFFELDLFQQGAGDVKSALRGAPNRIDNARYWLPSQQHFYMETQAATAVTGEDGTVTVYSATQSLDAVQLVVSRALDLPFNKVNAVCTRIGGAFGGKATRQMAVAAIAALGAWKSGRKVQFMLSRDEDLRQNAGRCPGFMDYSVGFDDQGVVTALDMQVTLQGGQYKDCSFADVMMLAMNADIAYNFPHMRVAVQLARCNTTPRTIMRAPGFLQACLCTDQVMEHVAAILGLDPIEVKARNFIPDPSVPTTLPKSITPVTPAHFSNRSGTPSTTSATTPGKSCVSTEPESIAPIRSLPLAKADNVIPGQSLQPSPVQALCHRPPRETQPAAAEAAALKLPLGRPLKADLYTMPRVWAQLKEDGQYQARKAQVQAFNDANIWRKKALVMTPCRFDAAALGSLAAVSIFYDGSVLITSSGMEMGQGLHTKLKQMAAWALGQALPEGQGPLPMDLIRVNTGSSFAVPGGGPTWGSTGSESACQAVRVACEELVETLKPIMQDKGDSLQSWKATLASTVQEPGVSSSSVQLSVTGFYSGAAEDGSPMAYSAFGAALTEVEIDVLTGDRSVARVDMLYDCGHSLNPLVDLGQIEGAFVMGMGMMLEEEVRTDTATGRLLTDSTWTYKIPTVACIPRKFNISFLKDSPNPVGIMGSKAVGEPGVMLSSSTIIALQQAVSTARNQIAQLLSAQNRHPTPNSVGNSVAHPCLGATFAPLFAPGTPPNLRKAVGDFWLVDVLSSALAQQEGPDYPRLHPQQQQQVDQAALLGEEGDSDSTEDGWVVVA